MSTSPAPPDDYYVALIKSLATKNRFYALAAENSGIANAEVIDEIPHDLLLGIAYPCLEDGLNDLAIIRTSYETLALFADDPDMSRELSEIILDARRSLTRRLMELLERLLARKAHFLGTDLDRFKAAALDIMRRGVPRDILDSMMKVNVFSSVAEVEAQQNSDSPASLNYRYAFCNSDALARLAQLDGREFLNSLFADVLDSVLDDANYGSKYTFDKNVFQQFIALMFMTYASTDAVFYGTNPEDYGVSKDKPMDDTPLYRAIGQELRRLSGLASENEKSDVPAEFVIDFGLNEDDSPDEVSQTQPAAPVQLPETLSNEDIILRPLASICAVAGQLQKHPRSDTAELSHLILSDVSRLVQELKRLGVLSPLAYDPGDSSPRAGE